MGVLVVLAVVAAVGVTAAVAVVAFQLVRTGRGLRDRVGVVGGRLAPLVAELKEEVAVAGEELDAIRRRQASGRRGAGAAARA